jgi:hypothetical protein
MVIVETPGSRSGTTQELRRRAWHLNYSSIFILLLFSVEEVRRLLRSLKELPTICLWRARTFLPHRRQSRQPSLSWVAAGAAAGPEATKVLPGSMRIDLAYPRRHLLQPWKLPPWRQMFRSGFLKLPTSLSQLAAPMTCLGFFFSE